MGHARLGVSAAALRRPVAWCVFTSWCASSFCAHGAAGKASARVIEPRPVGRLLGQPKEASPPFPRASRKPKTK